jgi:hypothetical protein
MATHRLPKFTHPDFLKTIAPERLISVFRPYTAYLSRRQFELPDDAAGEIDYEALSAIIIHPHEDVPREMVEALYYIHEMSSIEQMDDLLAAAHARRRRIDVGPDASPADVAACAWLAYPDLLREQHAEAYAARQRSFTYFAGRRGGPRSFPQPDAATVRRLEEDLDGWFEEHNRGRDSRVFIFDQSSKILIVVRHGLPFRREGSLRDGRPSIEFFRPEIHDVLVYDPDFDETGLHVHSRTVGEQKLYLSAVGQHLFGHEDYFPAKGRFTLAPLVERGAEALACEDVSGLEEIKLVEYQCYFGGQFKESEVRKASDIFSALGDRRRNDLARGQLKRAVFSIKLRGEAKARKVTIRPPNIAIYDRDSDSELVEKWLRNQGFIIPAADEQDATAEAAVDGVGDNPRFDHGAPGMEATP